MNAIVFKTAVLVRAKQLGLFWTAVFLETEIFAEYFKMQSYQVGPNSLFQLLETFCNILCKIVYFFDVQSCVV
jgi:hypothetical protein